MKPSKIQLPLEEDFEFFLDIDEIQEAHEFFSADEEESAHSHIKMGKLYAKAARYEEALEEYDLAISINPGKSDYYFHRGIAYFHLGLQREAMMDFATALESDSKNNFEILDFTGALKDLKMSTDDINTLMKTTKLNG